MLTKLTLVCSKIKTNIKTKQIVIITKYTVMYIRHFKICIDQLVVLNKVISGCYIIDSNGHELDQFNV